MSEAATNEPRQPDAPASQETDAPDAEQAVTKRLTVVGIGASAGGLAALQAFFDVLPDDSGMAFVVVTHMAPDKESLLPEILQRHTLMPVLQVQDLTAIRPDHVYVISPGRRILVTDSHLDTAAFEEPRGQRTPIDDFFRSLAAAHRQAVAVILSGSGTDGAVGVKAVKEEGGLLMVQEPAEAEYEGMPRAAIATGLADVVLPVAMLVQKLVRYHDNGVNVPADPEALTEDQLETLYRILTQVQVHTGHDFSQYKRGTLLRRIQRRIQLNGQQTLDAYLGRLRRDAAEAGALFNDLLIGVTHFFRDQESWEVLAEKVIPQLFEGKEEGDIVRVWSIGCATGEEAYSLAILLLQHAATIERPPAGRPGLQIFASDLDDNSLQKAREGVYPEAIEADVSPERLARWFVKEGHYYRVKQEVRDIVLFASHSVLRDPPFSRLDLISCRNLLIYLNRDLQQKVFEIFHYALRPERYLFLGSAESTEMLSGLFHTVDRQHRLYRARPSLGDRRYVPSLPLVIRRGEAQKRLPTPGERPHLRPKLAAEATTGLHQQLLEKGAPASLLVDEQNRVLHISETAGRYLRHPGGTLTDNLLKLVRPELQSELRTALSQAFGEEKSVLSRPVFVHFNGKAATARRVILAVRPQPAAEGLAGQPLALVFFLEDEITAPAGGRAEAEAAEEGPAAPSETGTATHPETGRVAQLEAEVQRLGQRLQASREQYEGANERLQSANEELQSINEEYRSTTEELETSKEELQSLNEELQTVNAELTSKLKEASHAHGDLENLLVATDNASLFLDRELRIQRYTASTAELFNIMPTDRGRSISHLTNRLNYPELADDANSVLKSLVPIEREVQDTEGRWFLAQLRPYRTPDERINGVVLSFVDINGLKEAEYALWVEKEYSGKIVDTVREGLLVLEPDLTVEFANLSFYEMFEVPEAETVGQPIYSLGNGQWDIPELHTLLEDILPEEKVFNGYRVHHTFEKVGYRVMLVNARRLDHVQKILLAIEDVTEKEQYEAELHALNEALEHRVAHRTAQVEQLSRDLTMAEHEERGRIAQILHDDLQQQLYALKLQLSFLRGELTAAAKEEIKGMEEVLEMAIQTSRRLSVDLSPPILEGEGLTEAIGWLASLMSERHHLQVEVEAESSFVILNLDRRVLLFQAVRELLFNVVKHAHAPKATVRLQVAGRPDQEKVYRIDVIDEGIGFDPEALLESGATRTGRGLLHTGQRLEMIGGRLEVASVPGDGTRVTILLPQDEEAVESHLEEE